MKFFTETRTKRNTAFVVLLVMLFALASGVANACLLNSGDENTDPGLAPWFATLWTGSQQLVSASRRVVEAATPIADLPLRVRYSRLTL